MLVISEQRIVVRVLTPVPEMAVCLKLYTYFTKEWLRDLVEILFCDAKKIETIARACSRRQATNKD